MYTARKSLPDDVLLCTEDYEKDKARAIVYCEQDAVFAHDPLGKEAAMLNKTDHCAMSSMRAT